MRLKRWKLYEKIIFILIVLTLIACQNQDQDSRIEKFENFLGKENSELLSKKVESLDKFLLINFKGYSLNEAYFEYLKIIESSGFENNDWKYKGTGRAGIKELFEKSGFRREIWHRPDTVWLEEGDVHWENIYIDKNDTTFVKGSTLSRDFDLIENKDSIINDYSQLLRFNLNGRFFRGLEQIKDSDSTLIYYIEDKRAATNISPTVLAGLLIYYKADFSDYFIKRIIAIELY